MHTVTIAEPRRLDLRTNFLWNMGGTAAYALAQWGMLVALAKIGSPEMVGVFSLALAIAVPVTTLTALSLRSVQATDAQTEFPFSSYFRLRAVAVVVAMLAIAGLALGGRYAAGTALVIAIVGLAKVVESVSDVYFGLFQKEERLDLIAKSMLMKGPLSLVVLSAALLWTKDLVWGVLALLATWLVILLFYDVRNGSRILARPGLAAPAGRAEGKFVLGRTERRLFWIALPLGFVTALGTLQQSVPRYTIESAVGLKGLGIFSAMLYLMNAGSMLVTALGQAATPRLAILFAGGDIPAFARLLWKLLLSGIALGLAGLLIAWAGGRELLTLLYTPEYAGYPRTFLILMAAALMANIFSFLGVALTSMRVFKIQAPVHLLITLVNLGLCLALVKPLGLDGAALALLGGLTGGSLAYGWIAFRRLSRKERRD